MDIELTCDQCSKLFSKKDGFYIYHFKCCSIECLKIIKFDHESTIMKPEKTSKTRGAFSCDCGGTT